MKDKKIKNIGITFIFSSLIFVVYMAVAKLAPFGPYSILTGDLNGIYVPEFSYIKDILDGTQGFGYSFNKALGGNTMGMISYYVSSPFLLLLKFFPKRYLQFFALFVFYLKTVLSSVFTDLYLQNKYGDIGGYDIVLGTCYGFMMYNFAYYQNIMWLDCVMLLPLIILGVEKILKNKSPLLYIISLAVCTWSNFYIALMCCIFTAMYFVWQYVTAFGAKIKMRPVTIFAIASIGGGMLPMFMVYPAIFQIFSSKSVGNVSRASQLGYSIIDLCQRMMLGAFQYENLIDGMPFVYSASVVTVAVVLFYVCEKIDLKDKIASGIVGIILLASFIVPKLNLIFHGMTTPVWFPHRHSFLIVFWAVILAGAVLKHAPQPKHILLCVGVSGLLCAGRLISKLNDVSHFNILFTLILLVGVSLLLCMRAKQKSVVIIIACVTAFEIVYNGNHTMNNLERYNSADFTSYYDMVQREVNIATADNRENGGNEFFRSERDKWRTLNDGMLYGFNGISHFDSTKDNFVTAAKYRFGYTAVNISTYRGCGNILGDSLLGIKYVYAQDGDIQPWQKDIGGGVYRNEFALPFVAYMHTDTSTEDVGVWDYFNAVYACLSGIDTKLAYWSYYDEENDSLYRNDMYAVDMDALKTATDAIRSQAIDYKIVKDTVTIKCNGDNAGCLFMCIPIDFGWHIKVNGENAPLKVAFEYFTAVDIPRGECTVEMYYQPPGTRLGVALSACGAISAVLAMAVYFKKDYRILKFLNNR